MVTLICGLEKFLAPSSIAPMSWESVDMQHHVTAIQHRAAGGNEKPCSDVYCDGDRRTRSDFSETASAEPTASLRDVRVFENPDVRGHRSIYATSSYNRRNNL